MPRSPRAPARAATLAAGVLALVLLGGVRPAAAQRLCDDTSPCDVTPPVMWTTPATGTHVTTSAVDITVSACDDSDVSYVVLSGAAGVLVTAYGEGWGCASAATTVSLRSGPNDLTAQACDISWHCTREVFTIVYDPPPPPPAYAIAVTPDGASAGAITTDQSGTVVFAVRNSGGVAGTLRLSVWCGGMIARCSVADGGATLAPAASATVSVAYVAGAAAGPGTVTTRACFVENAAVCDDGSFTFIVDRPPVASITVSPTSLALRRGQTVQLVATPYDATGRPLSGRAISYSSSDPEIAGMSTSGVLSALRSGTATIAIGSEGVSRTIPATVRVPVSSIELAPRAATLQVGQTVLLLAQLFDADGHELAVPQNGPPLSWTSSSAAVAVSMDGTATALSPGTATVAAAIDGRSGATVITVRSGTAPAAIAVTTRGLNPGTSLERDECLTIAAAANAAYECGDLRLVHPLPTTTTMGRPRTPTLIYSSAHAAAATPVAADVTYAGAASPTELVATLRIANRPDFIQRYPWRSACGSQPCRIVIPIADASLATGVYEYTLDVRAVNGGTVLASGAVVVDTLVVVNRARSAYGAGWWIDGIEQLVFPAEGRVLWVGGDGSTRLFQRHGSTDTYTPAAPVDRPEILEYVRASARWRRWLRNRAYVEFDAAGRHIATVDRRGLTTTFEYFAELPSSPLRAITLPVRSQAVSRAYTFAYQSLPSGDVVLGSITAPGQDGAPRVTTIGRASTSFAIASITDPSGATTTFGSTDARIDWRQNRLQDRTSFEYDGSGMLSGVAIDMLRTRGQRAAVKSLFCAAESYSRNPCASTIGVAVGVHTVWNGPRPPRAGGDDTTRFWVNRFGAPTRIRDALGRETLVERGDDRWPALITRVIDPRGHVATASYDERGRLVRSVDVNPDSTSPLAANRDAVTSYLWDDIWDFVRVVRGPSGTTITASFDPASGDRLWQRPGDDPARNTRFEYDQFHQVRDVFTPLSTTPTHYAYDEYGNLREQRSPLGFQLLSVRDALGRDSVTFTPIDSAQTLWRTLSVTYDAAGRVRMTSDEGPATAAVGAEAQALYLRNEYDDEDNLLAVHRWASPDPTAVGMLSTAYTYDELGRKLTETDPFDPGHAPATWQYDEAGNAIVTTNKRSQTITATYDVLNRVRTRSVPGVYNRAAGAVMNDEQYFGYDESGNLVVARNSSAEVGRGFTLGGRLAYDTLRIRAADLSLSGMRRQYALTNGYDIAGRRSWQRQPDNLPGQGATVAYGYDAVTGNLERIDDLGGRRFTYRYNDAGLLAQLTMPGGVVETHDYDADGRERYRKETANAGGVNESLLHEDRLTRDARGKVEAVTYMGSLGVTFRAALGYAALGATVTSRFDALDVDDVRFTVDAFGSVRTKRSAGSEQEPGTRIFTSTYEPHSNRLAQVDGALPRGATDRLTNSHDPDGNLTAVSYRQTTPPPPGSPTHVDAWWSAVYSYAADGKLMVSERTTVNDNVYWISDYRTAAARAQGHGVFEEYRYDALGRRIWKRAHRRPPWFPYCAANDAAINTDCLSAVSVTVWDGDQVLYELRAPGETSLSSYALESNLDCPVCNGYPAQHFGTVFYLHGTGIDRPLELVKDGTVAVLHTTWRGQVDRTTDENGNLSTCTWPTNTPGCLNVDWPGLETSYLNARPADRYRVGPKSWYGDLVQNNEDASRQQYMRNRYYDAGTGRFTQEDPIGIAGGINLYGFGGGDHVNYSDPFGLSACPPNCPPDNPDDLDQMWAVYDFVSQVNNAIVFGWLFGAVLESAGPTVGNTARASESRAVSTMRLTTAGEEFEHYSYTRHSASLAGGLRPGSYATSARGLTGIAAKQGLSLRHLAPPDAVYTVRPKPGTLVRVNPSTRPQFDQPGGLPEAQFPHGTEPGTVSPPRPIRPS